ncbi:hypothetical protein LTR53_015600 [Teratosphaeriaceae sp. CCFEE 6253]|nr:hypothetical protein LTR53_015600 [Teratosphaeriaceae sp. CCFEE 6253]
MAGRWRTLELREPAPPQLLIQAKLDSLGYTIHLTDLSRIWSETLTKRKIRKRADLIDCAIDPGEGDDQYQILLSKLRQAIDQEDDTTLQLLPSKKNDRELVLELSAPLPAPLPDLKWTIQLSSSPPQILESTLVRPLLYRAQSLESQIQGLLHELADKDRVISKITDRLETSGNDLTAVFPGVSNIKVSRKKSQREQLARHVKGLGDFDAVAWKAQCAGNVVRSRPGAEELSGVLGGLVDIDVDDESKGDAGEWWRELSRDALRSEQPSGSRNSQAQRPLTKQATNRHADSGGDIPMANEDDADGQFQRQLTPPRSKFADRDARERSPARGPSRTAPSIAKTSTAQDDESTEDEDDLDAPPPKASTIKSQRNGSPETVGAPSSPRRSSMLGGDLPSRSVEQKLAFVESLVSPPSKPRSKLGALGGKVEEASSTPEPAHETEASAPAKPRGKLGALGGKSKTLAAPDPSPPNTTTDTTPAPAARPHKLGALGGKKTTAPSSSDPNTVPAATVPMPKKDSSARQSRATTREATPPPRETSAERADRKREELKRKLTVEATAAGAAGKRKKRKF